LKRSTFFVILITVNISVATVVAAVVESAGTTGAVVAVIALVVGAVTAASIGAWLLPDRREILAPVAADERSRVAAEVAQEIATSPVTLRPRRRRRAF
jgi:hypothetical protein